VRGQEATDLLPPHLLRSYRVADPKYPNRLLALPVSGHRDLEVPQAPEAHDPSDDEDRAGQKEHELEAVKKRVHRRFKGALV
jgi:hypothetical protein